MAAAIRAVYPEASSVQDGRLLIYRNVGTRAKPKLGGKQWFDDAVPTGRVPKG